MALELSCERRSFAGWVGSPSGKMEVITDGWFVEVSVQVAGVVCMAVEAVTVLYSICFVVF